MSKEEIVLYNKKLGIETIFSSDLNTVGKVDGKVIYLNDNFEDLEQINRHEVLHFYEETPQFKKIKEITLNALNKGELDILRKEYRSLYFPLYKNEENIDEIIDNEIVIDFIIKDREYSVSIDDIVKDCYEVIVKSSSKMTVNKRYLNISLSKKIDGQYPRLSKWEKLFVLNYYTKGLPNGENKYETIKNDISSELQRLYEYADNPDNFAIDYKDNKYLEKEFEGEIEALKARGDSYSAEYSLRNKDKILQEMAKKFSETQQAEYKHIVNFIRNSDYEDSFKCLMLNETLTKIYKQEKVNDDSEMIISKREAHKSISGHMTLNEVVLDTIYNNLNDYNSFANLYYAGIAIFNNKINDKSGINIVGLNTYGMGKWIKFNGRSSDPDNYIKNAQDLSSLVQDTPWCTKTLASVQLEQGDFYVFVDHNNKPHIAVKMNGNEIDEVRGLKNGSAQELEDDYREIAIEFLTKNKDIKNGKEWLEKEEWNKRLIEWNKKIDEDSLKEEEIEILLYDVFGVDDYKSHGGTNSNKDLLLGKMKESNLVMDYFAENYESLMYGKEWYIVAKWEKRLIEWGKKIDGETFLKSDIDLLIYDLLVFREDNYQILANNFKYNNSIEEMIQKIKSSDFMKNLLADKFGCSIEKICFGNINLKEIKNGIFPYEVVFGNLESDIYSNSEIDMRNLKIILGNANFHGSFVRRMSNLKKIGGNAGFAGSQIEDLSSLVEIGRDAHFINTKITNLSKLERIGKYGYFQNCRIKEFPSLVTSNQILSDGPLKRYISREFEKKDGKYVRRIKNNKR